MRWNAGWPTIARVYLTKHKIRKVSDGTKIFGSVNWDSQPCMAEGSSKTLAPSKPIKEGVGVLFKGGKS
jgi:hypothetical protein